MEFRKLYLLPTRAAEADGTNPATRQETEYFGVNSAFSQFCLWFSDWLVYEQVLSKNDVTSGTTSIKTQPPKPVVSLLSSKTMVPFILVPRSSSDGLSGKRKDSTFSFCPNTVPR